MVYTKNRKISLGFLILLTFFTSSVKTAAISNAWSGGMYFILEGFGKTTAIYQSRYYSLGLFLDPCQFEIFNPSIYAGINAPMFPFSWKNTYFRYAVSLSIFNLKNHFLKSAFHDESWLNPTVLVEGLYHKGKEEYYLISFLPLRLKTADGYFSFFGFSAVLNRHFECTGWNVKLFETSLYLF